MIFGCTIKAVSKVSGTLRLLVRCPAIQIFSYTTQQVGKMPSDVSHVLSYLHSDLGS